MAVREAATTLHSKFRCVSVSPRIIPARPLRLGVQRPPLVMGVLNVTPDSFSDGGRWLDPGAAIERGIHMEAEGADLVDIGGESSRPGAAPVPAEEELRRTIPVIAGLVRAVRIPLSIDTSKAEVARRAIDAGASLVNDVTALRGDPDMGKVVARGHVPIILMHMRGTPQTMQRRPRYRDVVQEVATFLSRAAERAQAAGIARSRILLDPGLGFGKTLAHNLALLRGLPSLIRLGFPVVVGPSRKSFIGALLQADIGERLAGTLACVAYAQRCGAHIVRVHDVRETAQLLRMLEAIDR